MSTSTQIEWTDATWNPVTGCTKITRGCDFCYAERFSERFRNVPGHPFENGFDLTLRPKRLAQAYMLRVTNVKDICVDLARIDEIDNTWGGGTRKPRDEDMIKVKLS
jgi:hypothetical protein